MIHLEIAASVSATLVFDPVLLQQILDNLLCNALAHAPPNEPVAMQADASAGRLRIPVRDSGAGMPEAEMPMVPVVLARGMKGALDACSASVKSLACLPPAPPAGGQ